MGIIQFIYFAIVIIVFITTIDTYTDIEVIVGCFIGSLCWPIILFVLVCRIVIDVYKEFVKYIKNHF